MGGLFTSVCVPPTQGSVRCSSIARKRIESSATTTETGGLARADRRHWLVRRKQTFEFVSSYSENVGTVLTH